MQHSKNRPSDLIIEVGDHSTHPAQGVFYIVPFSEGWRLMVYRWNEVPEVDHAQLWRDHFVPVIAYHWSKVLSVGAEALAAKLLPLHQAFPQGRAFDLGGGFVIHGDDFPTEGEISPQLVEQAFFNERPDWEALPEFRCGYDARVAAIAALQLTT